MIKTILGKFEKGKVVPLQKLNNISAYRIYITLVPTNEPKGITEQNFIKSAKKAEALFRKNKLKEISSLKELDV